MEFIFKYFPDLLPSQVDQFRFLLPLYEDWNAKINVISRKDMDNFYLHHVLHSLAIAKAIKFRTGSTILDVGTGGGFPGIPLAILFPDSQFLLADSIGKKIKVVQAIASHLSLHNVEAVHCRAEDLAGKFDFIVSRAVTQLPAIVQWMGEKINSRQKHDFPNGILYLKGGDFQQELDQVGMYAQVYNLAKWFSEPFFETKKLVYLTHTQNVR